MPQTKTQWYLDELVYLKKNFHDKTAKELMQHLNENRNTKITYTVFRYKCRELNLIKYARPKFWSKREIKYLLNNYKFKGNIEIASVLNKYKNRTRLFTPGVIQKKMMHLSIKRTEKDLQYIYLEHKKKGLYKECQRKMIEATQYKEGEIFKRRHGNHNYYFIKKNGKVKFLHRHLWLSKYGEVPPKHRLYFKDGNTLNYNIDNIYCRIAGRVKYNFKRIPKI